MSERDRVRWLWRAAVIILVVGVAALVARPLVGLRQDIAAMRGLIGDQVALSDQLVDNTAEASERIGVQIDLTEDANEMLGAQLDATTDLRARAEEQTELVRRSISVQEQLLAISRELLEETRQARRCACAVAETTEPTDGEPVGGASTAAGDRPVRPASGRPTCRAM